MPLVVALPQESLALLDGGDHAYPPMLAAIAAATRIVHLEVYAFDSVGIGATFVDALAGAARRGVAVRVILDAWGSPGGGRGVAASLRAAGCDVSIHNPFTAFLAGRFGRNHRKILLVDDEVAFVGGINIGDENVDDALRLGWADVALEIRGPQAAQLRQLIFRQPRVPTTSALSLHVSRRGGGGRMRRRYLKAFASARHRIDVAHGYFLPDAGIVRAITAAARRGVAVHLLLAGRSDVPFARAASRSLYRQLLAAGVEIHEWNDSVLHAKIASVDGRRLLVGSFNLDPFSLANLEVLVEVDDPAVVAQGQSWIEDRFATSRVVTSIESTSRLARWVLEPQGRVVARVADAIGRAMSGHRAATARSPRGAGVARARDASEVMPMETREIYKEKYQAQIHEWTAKLDLLKARAEKMSAQTKLDAKPKIDSMHERVEHAKTKMSDIAEATDDKWEEVKKSLDHAWTETKGAFEGAYDAVMAMDGTPTPTPATPSTTPATTPSRGPGQGQKRVQG